MQQISPDSSDLIIKYTNLIKSVGNFFAKKYPHVDADEFFSAARLGGCEAARRFDPSLGFSFAPTCRKWCYWSCVAVLRDPLYSSQRLSYDEFDRGDDAEDGGARTIQRESPEKSSFLHGGENHSVTKLIHGAKIPEGQEIARLLAEGHSQEEIRDLLSLSESTFTSILEKLRLVLSPLHESTPHIRRLLSTGEYARKSKISLKGVYKQLADNQIGAQKRDGHWQIPLDIPLFDSGHVVSTALGHLLGLSRERDSRRSIDRLIKLSRKALSSNVCANKRHRVKKNTGGRHREEYLISPSMAIQVIKQSRTQKAKKLQIELKAYRGLSAQEQLIKVVSMYEWITN